MTIICFPIQIVYGWIVWSFIMLETQNKNFILLYQKLAGLHSRIQILNAYILQS